MVETKVAYVVRCELISPDENGEKIDFSGPWPEPTEHEGVWMVPRHDEPMAFFTLRNQPMGRWEIGKIYSFDVDLGGVS